MTRVDRLIERSLREARRLFNKNCDPFLLSQRPASSGLPTDLREDLLWAIMAFLHRHAPGEKPSSDDRAAVFSDGRILVRANAAGVSLPLFGELADIAKEAEAPLHVGLIEGKPVWLASFGKDFAKAPGGCEWRVTRSVVALLSPDEWAAANCALALFWWRRHHRFCGVCGHPTVEAPEERVMRCPECGALFYPTQSPAVIVSITRGEKLLLAHNCKFHPTMHSVLAGFVEPGETLESAVHREIREEVGIEIQNLAYVKSQSWPFPNSLMLAFRAEWKSGELRPDGVEIETAGWFKRWELPELPPVGSIARNLIDDWVNS
jgi:NAD+ diphosphatase